MTTLFSVGTFIDFLIILTGVPLMLWRDRPAGNGGVVWWAFVTAAVALFACVSCGTGLALAGDMPSSLKILIVPVDLFMIYVFFTVATSAA